jgi:predicted regulator of Ras-like GTPase activity (Roadblock/LC7/MglB family)
MKDLLESLAARSGVNAAFICDREGRTLAAALSDSGPQRSSEPLASIISQANTTLHSLKRGRMAEIEWVYSDGRVLVRGVGEALLCLVCERSVNLQLLSMKIDEVLEKIESAITAIPHEPSPQEISRLKMEMIGVALELLGDHAGKVVAILQSSADSTDGLDQACDQAEKVTRLFIDKSKAEELGSRIRALLDKRR